MPFGHIGEGPSPAQRKDDPRRFYHQDGAIRVYANRSMVLAGITSVVALLAVGSLIVVRMQPATVIRVGNDGQPSVLSPPHGEKTSILSSLLKGGSNPEAVPQEYEKEAFIRAFLIHYLNYDPHTLARNWADAMNQMTTNLRHTALLAMQRNDTVGKLEEGQASSSFKLSHIEESKTEPLTYTAFGVRTVRSLDKDREQIDQLVEEYHVRLVNTARSADNPSGLLIGDYWSKQIEGEKRDAVLSDSALAGMPSATSRGDQ
jgi:hypothetical protein